MRIAFVILCLTAIGLATVVCRHREIAAGREIHQLQRRLVEQRRVLWDLEARLAEVCALPAVRIRAQDMHTAMIAPEARDANTGYALVTDPAGVRPEAPGRGRTVGQR
ncbi:MAG: hypothetical protein GX591_17155 [Planctomycetes bacterium]|nr:hypothetical protein [Planctomycetota bacterium]